LHNAAIVAAILQFDTAGRIIAAPGGTYLAQGIEKSRKLAQAKALAHYRSIAKSLSSLQNITRYLAI